MNKRSRAWRRIKKRLKDSKPKKQTREKKEKNWKLLYTRANKLHRARQLGYFFPSRVKLEDVDDQM